MAFNMLAALGGASKNYVKQQEEKRQEESKSRLMQQQADIDYQNQSRIATLKDGFERRKLQDIRTMKAAENKAFLDAFTSNYRGSNADAGSVINDKTAATAKVQTPDGQKSTVTDSNSFAHPLMRRVPNLLSNEEILSYYDSYTGELNREGLLKRTDENEKKRQEAQGLNSTLMNTASELLNIGVSPKDQSQFIDHKTMELNKLGDDLVWTYNVSEEFLPQQREAIRSEAFKRLTRDATKDDVYNYLKSTYVEMPVVGEPNVSISGYKAAPMKEAKDLIEQDLGNTIRGSDVESMFNLANVDVLNGPRPGEEAGFATAALKGLTQGMLRGETRVNGESAENNYDTIRGIVSPLKIAMQNNFTQGRALDQLLVKPTLINGVDSKEVETYNIKPSKEELEKYDLDLRNYEKSRNDVLYIGQEAARTAEGWRAFNEVLPSLGGTDKDRQFIIDTVASGIMSESTAESIDNLFRLYKENPNFVVTVKDRIKEMNKAEDSVRDASIEAEQNSFQQEAFDRDKPVETPVETPVDTPMETKVSEMNSFADKFAPSKIGREANEWAINNAKNVIDSLGNALGLKEPAEVRAVIEDTPETKDTPENRNTIANLLKTVNNIGAGVKDVDFWSFNYNEKADLTKSAKFLLDAARFSDGSAPEEEAIDKWSGEAADAFIGDMRKVFPDMQLEDFKRLLKNTAYHESSGGQFVDQMNGGPAKGWWQVEPSTARDLLDDTKRAILIGPKANKIFEQEGFSIDALKNMDDKQFEEVLKIPAINVVFAAAKYATSTLQDKIDGKV